MGLLRVSYQHFSCLILIITSTFLSCGSGMTIEIKISPPTGKIVHGTNAIHGSIPYLVSIQTVHQQLAFCGGAILDRMTILTAAHCFTDRPSDCLEDSKDCYKIVAGEHDLKHYEGSEQTVVFSMSNVVVHEHYDRFHYDNDIALIRLKTPLNLSGYVEPIALIDPDIGHTDRAVIAGWGKNESNSKHDVEILQRTEVQIFSNQHCHNQWGDDYHAETMICAGAPSDSSQELVTDACQGDSGGPLMARSNTGHKRYLVGIISWGYDCGFREYPGLYTKVEAYLKWIERNRQG
ncbi:unnamed protein product [Orchesella dallaii]|uniref:Acrosin n=1 Tax=Orchesella dallaii TaxID=48710 RepID=A0ABP1QN38_9HEXA